MAETSRVGIGRIAAAVAVIVIVAIAGGVGIFLSSRGSTTTPTQSTTSSSSVPSTTSSSVVTTNSTSQTSNSTTSSSSSIVPVGCVFAPPGPLIVPKGQAFFFTGCLTAGATGVYLVGITDPNGLIVQGVIKSQYASNITIAGAPVANLTAGGKGGIAISGNDTTVVGMPDLLLFGSRGYAITVVNQSGQNNTVTINLILNDAAAFEA
jgi:cytoskeletal protein RodZ